MPPDCFDIEAFVVGAAFGYVVGRSLHSSSGPLDEGRPVPATLLTMPPPLPPRPVEGARAFDETAGERRPAAPWPVRGLYRID